MQSTIIATTATTTATTTTKPKITYADLLRSCQNDANMIGEGVWKIRKHKICNVTMPSSEEGEKTAEICLPYTILIVKTSNEIGKSDQQEVFILYDHSKDKKGKFGKGRFMLRLTKEDLQKSIIIDEKSLREKIDSAIKLNASIKKGDPKLLFFKKSQSEAQLSDVEREAQISDIAAPTGIGVRALPCSKHNGEKKIELILSMAEGMPMSKYLTTMPLDLSNRLHIFKQTIQTLKDIHDAGIAHHDLHIGRTHIKFSPTC